MNRTRKVCQNCGAIFEGSRDRFYCPACARQRKTESVMRTRVCKDCGAEFIGGPRAMRCPSCAAYARAQYKQKPTKRPIGSIDKCLVCGAEYTVMSGRQKYCSDACQKIAVKEWQREHKKGYAKLSGQDKKRQERRSKSRKVCIYCLREFESHTPTNLCSDYCRRQQHTLQYCMYDIKRGNKRGLDKYIQKRSEYRAQVKEEKK